MTKAGGNHRIANEASMSGLHLLCISNEIVVHSVDEGSPAQKAGIQANDVITQINNKDSNAYEMWDEELAAYKSMVSVDSTNVMISAGTDLQGDAYIVKIDYIL